MANITSSTSSNRFGDHVGLPYVVGPRRHPATLIHWQELPVALREENAIMIFTGSTVMDERNSSGFCANGKPCMVAVYTGHTPEAPGHPGSLQTQNAGVQQRPVDGRGPSHSGNPVLNLNMSDFRDLGCVLVESGAPMDDGCGIAQRAQGSA